MDDDRRDEIINLVRNRCPEIREDELTELMGPGPGDGMPIEVVDQIADLIEMLESRLSRLEGREQWV